MSLPENFPTVSKGVNYEKLAAPFRPIFQRIAEGAVERELNRTLPYEPIKWLKEAGFGAVRVPLAYGGGGASVPQLFHLLVELATADSNLPQALRGHFAFVEDRLNAPDDANQKEWFKRFVAGDLVGNAWTEVGEVKIGEVITYVTPQADNWVLNGRKYYSTGSIFADWIDVFARRSDNQANVIAAVRTKQAGVTLVDDWDGFGQKTTGSGTTVFENVEVKPINIIDFSQRFKYQTAFYQLVHLATLAGIAQAATHDIAEQVAKRTRIFSNGNAPLVKLDPQIQQVVGQIASQAYAAKAIALSAAEPAQRAYIARIENNLEAEKQANIEAELESAQGQIVIADLVLKATSDLFNALGASSARSHLALDRHWRNARTVATHNPLIYKARIVGDWAINGTEPPYIWQIGASPLSTN